MPARPSAMVQDFFAIAPGILKGIGEDWKAVEGKFIVNARREIMDSGRSPFGLPKRWELMTHICIAKDFSQ